MLQDFKSWVASPFSSDMDALHWFYFFGLLIAISVLWSFVLRELRGATT